MPKKVEKLAKPMVGDPSDPLGFAALRDDYLESLQVQNYSERTVENRLSYLNTFILWCEARELHRQADIT